MTNADKIRVMTDEELAELLECIFDNLVDTNIGTIDFPCECCTEKINCDVCFLKWLQSEVKESETE